MANFKFSGTVVNHLGEPIPNAKISIIDKDIKYPDGVINQFLWTGTTDNKGKYQGTTTTDWDNQFLDVKALFFKVEKDGKIHVGPLILLHNNEFVPIVWVFNP